MCRNIVEMSQDMLHKIVSAIPEVISIVNLEGTVVYVNEAIIKMGIVDSIQEAIGKNCLFWFTADDKIKGLGNLEKMLNGQLGPVEYRGYKRDGTIIDVEVSGEVLETIDAAPEYLIFIVRDITSRKQAQVDLKNAKAEIEQMNIQLVEKNLTLMNMNKILEGKSTKDSLTNLYNHRYIIDAIEEEINRAKRYKSDLSIMMLDIDNFKSINDQYGHQVGDKILITIGKILQNCLRTIDLVGRCGGDEFLILLPGTNLEDAFYVAERIRKDIKNEKFGSDEIKVTVSLGIVNSLAKETLSLIKRADDLLYKAKSNGRNRVEK